MGISIKMALTKARKLWGKAAYVEWTPQALTDEQKAPLIAEARALRRIRDTEKTFTPEQSRRLRWIQSEILGDRAKVGYVSGVGGLRFFHVRGSGDTFEKAFEKAEKSEGNALTLQQTS